MCYVITWTLLTLRLWLMCRQSIIDECFSKESVKQIIQAFVSSIWFPLEHESFPGLFSRYWIYIYIYVVLLQEAEGSKEGNEWITPIIKGLKRSSPTGLKITLRSVSIYLLHDFTLFIIFSLCINSLLKIWWVFFYTVFVTDSWR